MERLFNRRGCARRLWRTIRGFVQIVPAKKRTKTNGGEKNKMKRAITILLALVMALSLAACGSSSGTATEETPSSKDEGTTSQSGEGIDVAEEQREDMVSVESITLTPVLNVGQTEIQAKIRNLTDEKKDYISLYLQALDENGDVLTDSQSVSVENVQPGQAANSSTGLRIYCSYEEICAIRVYSYSFGVKSETHPGAHNIVEEIDFIEPITFSMSEIISNEGINSYIWMITP